MPQYMPHVMSQTPPPTAASAPASTSSNTVFPALTLSSAPLVKTDNSSHPPFKCPMVGIFYWIPAIGVFSEKNISVAIGLGAISVTLSSFANIFSITSSAAFNACENHGSRLRTI
ncbi:hypothetical protein V6N11_017007 [Hibiscus sabdariffa]|uniref:Uncharacterized protein n=1 Tax=Hibiscus sabdariffa TaxID=183260 RepID=A0ABR2TWT6_9ROSI